MGQRRDDGIHQEKPGCKISGIVTIELRPSSAIGSVEGTLSDRIFVDGRDAGTKQ